MKKNSLPVGSSSSKTFYHFETELSGYRPNSRNNTTRCKDCKLRIILPAEKETLGIVHIG